MNNNFNMNDWVKITIKNKSVICGQVIALGKKLVEGEEHDFYQVRVLDDRETTVFDVQMVAIEKVYSDVELQNQVIEIAAKYGIYVGDDLDLRRKLANSVIGLAGHWAELSEDEKKIFGYFAANPSMVMAIMGIANTYMSCYMSTQADFIEYVEKQAEKEKAEQDKGIVSFMEKYYPKSDNSLLAGYELSGYGTGETLWQPINH